MTKTRSIHELCDIWNDATNPAILRSDHEHKRHNQRARAAMRLIERSYQYGWHYREAEHSSRLVPLPNTWGRELWAANYK